MANEQMTAEQVVANLGADDLVKLREILATGVHELTPSQVNTLKSLIELYSEYHTELKTLVEEKKVSALWAKVRLQALVTLKYALYFVAAIFATVQSIDAATGILKKWWHA